jgi:ATP-dependent helicase/nuclease subunit A
MTVHGAKGLEADVVFLVDTGGAAVVPGQRDVLRDIGRDRDDPAFLWRRRKEEAPPLQRAADATADAEEEREYLRLLYVAMTRARDVLYIAGVRLLRPPESSWYTIVRDALLPKDRSGLAFDDDGELPAPFVWPESLRPPRGADAEKPATQAAPRRAPEWLERSAPTPPRAPQPLRPSNALAEPDPFPAGWRVPDADALRRGQAIHLLLQFLPSIPPGGRRAAAERLLAGEAMLSPDRAAALCDEAGAVLAHPALAGVFTGEARSEVAIVGSVATTRGDYVVSGRIDRLVRDAGGWRLIDFKTDRRVPGSLSEVDPGYVLQLALYRKLLMEMEPGVRVAASLVYTAGPNVVPVPEDSLENALETLGVRANTVS